MKKIILLVVLILCIGVSALADEAKKKKPPPPLKPQIDQVIVKLPGNVPWKPTGIVLRESDRVEFKATGQVCFSGTDPVSCVSPTGYDRNYYYQDFPVDHGFCADPMGGDFSGWEGHAGLLAKDDYGMYFVGSDRTMTGRKGPLSIGINDCTFTGDYYNTGEFSVVIKVTRGGK
jgi:hypothetical protein